MNVTDNLDYFTIEHKPREEGEPWHVYGWGTYPRSSVLAGQARKVWLDSYETLEAAQAAHPEAQCSGPLLNPQPSFNHLPDENDPVPGGMYPDDWS